MARLGRGQPAYQTGHSKLGAPQVVDGAVVYPGPSVTLAPPLTTGDIERRRSSWKLRPPTVVTTDVFTGPKPRFASAKPGDPRRRAKPFFVGPAVISPRPGAFGGLGISLADARNARGDGRRQSKSKLQPPQVVTTGVAFVADPVRVYRTEPHRPITTKSALRLPTVVAPLVYPPRVSLTEPHKPAKTRFLLRPPTVVDGAVIYGPLSVKLTEPHRPPATHGKVLPPAVVAAFFVADPLRVYRTEPHRPAATRTRLEPPTAVDGAQVFGPVRVQPTRTRNPRIVQSNLQPPTVIDTPLQPPVDVTVDVTLAPSRDVPRRLSKSELRSPTAVDGAVVFPPPATTLAPQPKQARAPKSELRAPQVVTEVFYARAPAIHLAPSSRLARRSHSRLTPPTVVAPSTYYLDVHLVPSSRLARGTHFEVRPPTVVFPFIPTPLAVSLRVTGKEIGPRRPVHPRLYPPTVITFPSDVIYDEPFDPNPARGVAGGRASQAAFDDAAVTGVVRGAPTEGAFDPAAPIGVVDMRNPED